MPSETSLTVLLAHPDEATRKTIRNGLDDSQYTVLEGCTTAGSLVRRALEERPGLIITGIDFPDADGISALIEISQSEVVPAIVVTSRRSAEMVERALKDHVMAYLMEPVRAEEVRPAVLLVQKRFEQFKEMRQEVLDLRQALSDRKIIERVKGILMEKHDLTEDEAYKRLRRMATDRRIKLIEAARQLLDVETSSAGA